MAFQSLSKITAKNLKNLFRKTRRFFRHSRSLFKKVLKNPFVSKIRKFFKPFVLCLYRNKTKVKSILFWFSITIFFLALTLAFTYPLILNLHKGLIGIGDWTDDGPFFVWNLWWVKKALLAHQDPFFTQIIYSPSKVNLSLHTLTLTTGIISIAFQAFFNLVESLNLIQIISLVVSALGMMILVNYLTGERIAGIISGVIFAFSPYVASQLLSGHYNLTMLWPIPFAILFLFKTIRENKIRNPILLALFLLLTAYLDLQLLAFTGLIAGLIFLYYVILEPKNIFYSRKLLFWLIAILIFGGLFFIPYRSLMKDFWSKREILSTYNNGDFKIIFSQNPLNPFLGQDNFKLTQKLVGSFRENTISIGWTVMAMILMIILTAPFSKKNLKEKFIFLVLFLIGIILAAGPYFQYGGLIYYNFKLPFYHLLKVPFIDLGVVPTRFILISYFSAAVLSGLLAADIIGLAKRRFSKILAFTIILSLTALVLVEYYSGPMKIIQLPTESPSLEKIKNDRKNLPFDVLPVFASQKDVYFQTIYDKAMVGGSLGRRINKSYLLGYAQTPELYRLIFCCSVPGDFTDLEKANLLKSFEKYKIRYILVDKTLKSRDMIKDFRKFFSDKMGWPVFLEDETNVVYKVGP